MFRFVTRMPACGEGFFHPRDLFDVVGVFEPPAHFVNCGRMRPDVLSLIPTPKFYRSVPEEYQPKNLPGVKYVRIRGGTDDQGRYVGEIQIPEQEAIAQGWRRSAMLSHLTYETRLAEWHPQMEVRDVPEEFLDREAMRKMAAGEPVMEKPLPRQEVELVVIIPVQGDDPALDEPEEQFEEPLSEALEEAECGSCTSSGTTPDSFDIDVDTVKPSLRRCLSVIRRVLTKAGAPAATIIRQLPDDPNDPPIDHPLEAPPAAPKKTARK